MPVSFRAFLAQFIVGETQLAAETERLMPSNGAVTARPVMTVA